MSTAAANKSTSGKSTANLAVSAGPDRGKTLRVTEELIHIGRGAENHLVLTDVEVADHQLSIVLRGGRYAVYTPLEASVEVDGNLIPHARWVWLPGSAKIRISPKTVLHFSESVEVGGRPRDAATDSVTADSVAAESVALEPAALGLAAPKSSGKAPAKKKKKDAAVAKFITDTGGEAMVKLGADGQLPVLSLTEAAERAAAREKPKETNPLLVYGILAFSFLMSGLLLFVDSDDSGVSSGERGKALAEIRSFYGDDSKAIERWQQLLREARLAASRGDRAAERRAYRRVLQMVNAEDNKEKKTYIGLTGDVKRDEDLRRLIGTLLRE